MFQNIYPVFEAKRLLRKEMLDNLRDYPRNLFHIRHQGYSDGILWGCGLVGTDLGLTVMPGILYYKGMPYFLEKPCTVACRADGKLVYLKVRFFDKAVGNGGEEYFTQLAADEQEPDPELELELGRFKLQPGARLRTEYVDFYDYITEFDTVNRIYTPYAAPNRQGIFPQLLQCFAKTLAKSYIKNPWDYAFCMSCLQLREAMPYEAVRVYLNTRLGQERDYTNMQIYQELKGILEQSAGEQQGPRGPERKEKTLLMI